MPDITQTALSLLSEIDALSERASASIDKIEAEFSMLDSLIEDRSVLLNTFTNFARTASVSAIDALGDSVEEKIDQTRASAELAIAVISQVEAQVSQQITGDNGLLEIFDKAAMEIQSVEETATALLEEGSEQAVEVFDEIKAQLATMSNDLENAIVTLENELEAQADDAAAQVADNLVAPLREAAETIKSTWDRLFDEQVTEVLDTLFESVNAEIQEPLDEAVDQMAGLLEEELEKLVQELLTGDAEGSSVRAGLEEALGTLEEAIAPMEAALEAFRGLASSVGVDF